MAPVMMMMKMKLCQLLILLLGITFRSSSAFWASSLPRQRGAHHHPPPTPERPRRHAIGNNNHHSSSSVQHEETLSTATDRCWTRAQVEAYALQQGVVVRLTTLGPGYRAVARCRHDPSLILGYVEGFVRPTAAGPTKMLLHLDQMQVFRPVVQRARRENPQQFRGGGTVLGVGLLMGYLCLLHGQEQGCHVAEFLAIDDQELQHKRLVRFYKHAGFALVKYVGDGFMDIPDRMVWGGCGTLLRQDIPVLLESWTRLMEKSLEKDKRI